MTISVNNFITDMSIQLGDPSNAIWPAAQLLSFMKRAYRVSWPWFFHPVYDDYSFTGDNSIAENTHTAPVPVGFLAAPSTTEVAQNGEITGLEVRLTGTASVVTTPVPQVWFPVTRAAIDDFAIWPNQTPRIRFLQPWNNIFEMRIHGCIPLTVPAALGTAALDGSDFAGFLEWLTYQVKVYCMENKETNPQDDKRGFGRRELLSQAAADKMRWRYRMPKPYLTQFVQIGR